MDPGFPFQLPVAATMDLQYRLPPFQQILFTPTILISAILLGAALVVLVYLSHRARSKARIQSRLDALATAERILLKRGGNDEDVQRVLYIFKEHPKVDPAGVVMVRERFEEQMAPLLVETFGQDFADRIQKMYYPPVKDTRRAIGGRPKQGAPGPEDKKAQGGQTPAAILDLMDATLHPGVVIRLTFDGVEGGYECLVMGHDMHGLNVTLPAHNDSLVASLRPGMKIEGSLESGPSLLGFTSLVIQAVAGSMPYCRISPWKSAWEVRKRDSVRLPISLEIDFQHISTSQTESITMSNLAKEIGSIRPGRLMDLSLGGCCIETPSGSTFRVGDMIRFSKSLVSGNPPATLLGAVVNVAEIDPGRNEGSKQRLHVQFLVIDDVSQRILVRTLRQLQDVVEREEWMQAQQLMQMMRRNKIENIGSPSPANRRESTGYGAAGAAASKGPAKKPDSARDRIAAIRPPTRAHAKVPPGSPTKARPSTRSLPKVLPPKPPAGEK